MPALPRQAESYTTPVDVQGRQGGSVLPIHPPTTKFLTPVLMTGNNASGTYKPGKTRKAPKGGSAMDEFWFSDRTARRYSDRLQKAQKQRNQENAKGFG